MTISFDIYWQIDNDIKTKQYILQTFRRIDRKDEKGWSWLSR